MEDRVDNEDMVADILLLRGPDIRIRHAFFNDIILVLINELLQDSSENANRKNPKQTFHLLLYIWHLYLLFS